MEATATKVNFYNWHPSPIVSLAFKEKSKLLAVGRSSTDKERRDCCVEVWKVTPDYVVQMACTFEADNINSVFWFCESVLVLFDHEIVQYSPNLTSRKVHPVGSGSPLFCAAAWRDRLVAVGSSGSHVVVYAYADGTLKMDARFPSRHTVTALGWNDAGTQLACGSDEGTIVIYDVELEQVRHEIDLKSTRAAQQPLVVWCLAYVADLNVFVSGDAYGFVSFWCASSGVLVSQARTKSKKSVMCVCTAVAGDSNADPTTTTVYAGGQDGVITSYVFEPSSGVWIDTVRYPDHRHAVLAVCSAVGWLVSGGDSGRLACFRYPPKVRLQLPALPHLGAKTNRDGTRVLLRYPKCVQLWNVEKQPPRKLAEISARRVAACVDHVTLSGPGSALAYTLGEAVCVATIPGDQLSETMHKFRFLPRDAEGDKVRPMCLELLDDDVLLVGSSDGRLLVYALGDEEPTLTSETTVSVSETVGIRRAQASDFGVAVLDENNRVSVVMTSPYSPASLDEPVLARTRHLPRGYDSDVLAFSFCDTVLTIAYSDNSLMRYDFGKQRIISMLPLNFLPKFTTVRCMSESATQLMLATADCIYVLEKKLLPSGSDGKLSPGEKFKVYKYPANDIAGSVVLSTITSTNDIFYVMLDQENIANSLPPAYVKHMYGT